MNKSSQCILLTTNELSKEGQICDTAYGYAISGKDGIGMGQHLYILSDGDIEEGDWYFDTRLNKIFCANDLPNLEWLNHDKPKRHFYKIIATTNTDLHYRQYEGKDTLENPYYRNSVGNILPPDIEYIISLYNAEKKSSRDGAMEWWDSLRSTRLVDGTKDKGHYADCYFGFNMRMFQHLTGIEIEMIWLKYQPKIYTVMVEYEEIEYSTRASDCISHDDINFKLQPKLKDGNIIIVR